MTPPKSVASLAQDYIEHNAVPPGECSLYWKEGFMCGHAAGLAEAGELMRACEKIANIIARPISMTDALMQLSEVEARISEALTRFKALAGEK